MKSPLAIGLTGGIGAGKTTVARIFETLGIPVYYADEEAKRLMNEDPGLRESITKLFGPEVYHEGGLDRKYLSTIIFNDEGKRDKLNKLVHPVTISHADAWRKSQHSPYIIKEAALLFESGADKALDEVICVSSPLEIRIGRVMSRDRITRDEVLKRINSQMDEKTKLSLSDHIIENDDDHFLTPQVLLIHDKILSRTRQS